MSAYGKQSAPKGRSCVTSAHVSLRQLTSAYVSIRQHMARKVHQKAIPALQRGISELK
jgi:hypothetical protein